MKFFLIFYFCFPLFAQTPINTEIFIFDINKSKEEIKIINGQNISQNPGYDNQPAFFAGDTVIFSKSREGQTDISGMSLKNSKSFWKTHTIAGSEYSPQRIPGTKDIASVRLDTSGL